MVSLVDYGPPLLQMVQDTCIELGLPVPSYVINSPDATARQLGGLMKRLGEMLLRHEDWTILTREWHLTVPPPTVLTGNLTKGSALITGLGALAVSALLPQQMTVSATGLMTSTRLIAVDNIAGTATVDQPAAATTSGATVNFRQDTFRAPDDFLRVIDRTHWDRTMRWELRGPQSPQSDQWVRSGVVATGPRRHYRQFGPYARIWPPPSATDAPSQLVVEYISGAYVLNASGNWQFDWQHDSDRCVFDPDLLVSGLKYLFFQVKGFDFGEFKSQFMRTLQSLVAADGGAPTLEMGRTRIPILISPANVQDAFFGGAFGNP